MEVNFKVGQRYQLTNGNVVTILRVFKDGSAGASCGSRTIRIYAKDISRLTDEKQ
jgi:hypothetical protein